MSVCPPSSRDTRTCRRREVVPEKPLVDEARSHSDDVAGHVLGNGVSSSYLEELRLLLPPAAFSQLDQALCEGVELQWVDESSAQVAAARDFGDLPLAISAIEELDSDVHRMESDQLTIGALSERSGVAPRLYASTKARA